jgi:hypothetical protein
MAPNSPTFPVTGGVNTCPEKKNFKKQKQTKNHKKPTKTRLQTRGARKLVSHNRVATKQRRSPREMSVSSRSSNHVTRGSVL